MMMRETQAGRDLVDRVMAIANGEIGQAERIKKNGKLVANPRIAEYDSVTRGGEADPSTPWCAAFACWVLEQAGIESPRSKAAIDFEAWGVPVWDYSMPIVNGPHMLETGLICVFHRNDPKNPRARHVGFLRGNDGMDLVIVSGNDHDAVRASWRHARDLTAVRAMPIPETRTAR